MRYHDLNEFMSLTLDLERQGHISFLINDYVSVFKNQPLRWLLCLAKALFLHESS